jgi:hypothetical protein
MDKSGECSLTNHRFTVETTSPEAGELTSGPDYMEVLFLCNLFAMNC